MELSEQDRQRLVGILGMLGSEHDGERANAARKAEQLRRKSGATWDELLTGQIVYKDREVIVTKYLPPRLNLNALTDNAVMVAIWVAVPLGLFLFLAH